MVYFIHHWKKEQIAIFSEEKSSSATVLILLSHCASINFFFSRSNFSTYLSFKTWTLNSWIFCITFNSWFWVSDFWNFLDVLNAGYHERYITWRYLDHTHLENISYANFFWYVQWSWSHAFWLLNNKIFLKILLVARPENRTRKKREKNKNSNCKSFRVKRKHKTPNEKSMAQPYIKPVSRILEKDTICGKKVWILNSGLEYTILPKFYVIS